MIVITGANQGGKSTFLRAMGAAQVMMQAGLFVPASHFEADVAPAIFTHYKRQEDRTMKRGKFDEELSRLNDIVDGLTPAAILLLNESFSATNEIEGSQIAGQVIQALLEAGVRVWFVTHLYQFAHAAQQHYHDTALFLRAKRQDDGTRTFELHPGEPLATSFANDLYHQIFGPAHR
jgi:DNA mismatch repair ATPase MutS